MTVVARRRRPAAAAPRDCRAIRAVLKTNATARSTWTSSACALPGVSYYRRRSCAPARYRVSASNVYIHHSPPRRNRISENKHTAAVDNSIRHIPRAEIP